MAVWTLVCVVFVGSQIRSDIVVKGFIFETGHNGSIAILDATGDPLSKTMKFLEYATASAFLDVVGHAGATLNAADALGLSLSAKNAPLRQKPQTRLSR
jgi:hypothetical protein